MDFKPHFAYFDALCEIGVILQPVLIALAGGAFFTGLPSWLIGVFALAAYMDAQFLKLCVPSGAVNRMANGGVSIVDSVPVERIQPAAEPAPAPVLDSHLTGGQG